MIIIDQSDNFDEIFYEKYNLNIKVLYQRKAVWRARNKGSKIKKQLLLFLDDDSIKPQLDFGTFEILTFLMLTYLLEFLYHWYMLKHYSHIDGEIN